MNIKVDSNKLWRDVLNEVTLICAKFGKDLFNVCKVIGRKTKWLLLLSYPVGFTIVYIILLNDLYCSVVVLSQVDLNYIVALYKTENGCHRALCAASDHLLFCR